MVNPKGEVNNSSWSLELGPKSVNGFLTALVFTSLDHSKPLEDSNE